MDNSAQPRHALFLQGSYAHLHPFLTEDAPYLFRWLNDPVVRGAFPRYLEPATEQDMRRWIDAGAFVPHHSTTFTVLSVSHEPIGVVGWRDAPPRDRRADADVVMSAEYLTNRDVLRDALHLLHAYLFRSANMRKVSWFVAPEAQPILRDALNDVGATTEGVLQEHWYAYGSYLTVELLRVESEAWARAWREAQHTPPAPRLPAPPTPPQGHNDSNKEAA